MTSPIRVCVFTGTRAEYGLLAPLLRQIRQHDDLELYLLVSGTHLSHLHGYTIDHIIADGFVPDARLESVLASDSAQSVCKGIALTVLDVSAELERAACDYIVVLGDRFEALAVATAAVVHGVPVVHLHGGEASEGATDDRFRHAITKLSDLHFVAGEEFATRVRQMGEPSDRVFVCGPAVQDVLSTLTTMTKTDLESLLGTTFDSPTALLVYHPATAVNENPAEAVESIFNGLFEAGIQRVLASLPNADAGSASVREAIEQRATTDTRVVAFGSIGQSAYLSLLRDCDVIVGNSSSGIIEAPLLGTPTVNVGSRQDGRPRAPSVIDVRVNANSIGEACEQALGGTMIKSGTGSPYGVGASMAERVVNVLTSTDAESLRRKPFSDEVRS
jgi:UDP-hydrolysing UDP-N-acetyl-D-glucosamine 2-epimerase